MDIGVWGLLGIGLLVLTFGILNLTTALRIRKSKKTVYATRRKAWIKKLSDKEVEKHAKGRLQLAVAALVLGTFLLGGFLFLILR